MILFVTGTGTDVGKTYVAERILRRWRDTGHQPVGIKPIETDCTPDPKDAQLLASVSKEDFTSHPGFFRAPEPLAPLATSVDANWDSIVSACRGFAQRPLLVEGAGGPLVPVTEEHFVIDLAAELSASVLLVAANRLGVLSYTYTAVESIRARGLSIAAIVLNDMGIANDTNDTNDTNADVSIASNPTLIRNALGLPVYEVGELSALADALIQTQPAP
ncbi:MAG: dethiobiotin synthase [Myxococcota bacterium]